MLSGRSRIITCWRFVLVIVTFPTDLMANTTFQYCHHLSLHVSLILLALLGTGGWVAYQTYHERERIEPGSYWKSKPRWIGSNVRTNDWTWRCGCSRSIIVWPRSTSSTRRPKTGGRCTTSFSSWSSDPVVNRCGEKKVFTVEGDMVYLDAWVIKYGDD